MQLCCVVEWLEMLASVAICHCYYILSEGCCRGGGPIPQHHPRLAADAEARVLKDLTRRRAPRSWVRARLVQVPELHHDGQGQVPHLPGATEAGLLNSWAKPVSLWTLAEAREDGAAILSETPQLAPQLTDVWPRPAANSEGSGWNCSFLASSSCRKDDSVVLGSEQDLTQGFIALGWPTTPFSRQLR